MPEPKILQIGAEAIILRNGKEIIKKRGKKSYRISEIDEKIRKLRTRSEGRLLERASKLIKIPEIKKVDEKNKEIIMNFVDGKRLSDSLDDLSVEKQKEICGQIGESVAKLHDSNIIHGDLTTSNMILEEDNIFFIDFGLGFISSKAEDKAVDLHLFKEALEARHFKHWEILFKEFFKGYEKYSGHKKILEQLKKVEKRGRYKERY